MSSRVLYSNFFNEQSIEITGASNRYDLRWNPENGDVEIVQRGIVLDGEPIKLFENNTWSKWGIDNATKGNFVGNIEGSFYSGASFDYIPDELANPTERKAYSLRIANLILKAREANGGGVVPEWVEAIGKVDTDEEKNLILDKHINGVLDKKVENINLMPEDSAPPMMWADIKKTDITLNTIKELMIDGPLKYPVDAIYNNRKTGYNQDHVRITQYTYKPPRPNLVGYKDNEGGSQTGLQIATEGAKRYSPLEKYLGMVRLPMPTDISDSNNVAWGQDTMNNISAALTAGVGSNLGATAAMAGGGKVLEALGSAFGINVGGLGNLGVFLGAIQGAGFNGKSINNLANISPTLRTTLQSRLLAMAGQQVSPEAILARGLGIIPNSNMELLFNSPTLREFAFSWKMTPRDEYEAKKVRHIIRFFKQGMAARKILPTSGGSSSAGTQSVYLGTPNVFHVQYKTNRDEDIEGVNRIKTCAVTGCSINYTPDGVWSAYEEGQPVSTVMSLRMQELEPVYDTDYQGDITEGRKFRETPGSPGSKAGGDLYKISLDEVGY